MKLVIISIITIVVFSGCTTSPLAHNSGVLAIGKNLYTVTAVNATASSAKQDAIKVATKYCDHINKSLEVSNLTNDSDAFGWHSADATFKCL